MKSNQTSTANALFERIIDDRYAMMEKKKKDNPYLVLPKDFDKFIKTQQFINLLITIFDYCTEISKLEQKQKVLQIQSKDRQGLEPSLLQSEIDKVNKKLSDVTEVYTKIILQKGSYNYMYKDQNFFETLIYFITQVLREMFQKEEYKMLEEEINRIFRTNSFNIIQRRHNWEQLEKQYPSIKEQNIKDINLKDSKQLDDLCKKFVRLSTIPRRQFKPQMMQEKSQIRPYYIKQTACSSINSCSPLIAMILPQSKERLFQQERERKQRSIKYAEIGTIRKRQLSMWIQDSEGRDHRSNSIQNKSFT